MDYKIKVGNLKKAIYEAAMQRKNGYENLNFVDKALKSKTSYIKEAKRIIVSKKDNGKTLYEYLIKECGCASRYDDIAKPMGYAPEQDILFNMSEEGYDEDNAYAEYGDETMYDYTLDNEDDFLGAEYEAEQDFPPVFEYWIAEKMNESGDNETKIARMAGMDEARIKKNVMAMESKGYSMKAFSNESEMNDYLSEVRGTSQATPLVDFLMKKNPDLMNSIEQHLKYEMNIENVDKNRVENTLRNYLDGGDEIHFTLEIDNYLSDYVNNMLALTKPMSFDENVEKKKK